MAQKPTMVEITDDQGKVIGLVKAETLDKGRAAVEAELAAQKPQQPMADLGLQLPPRGSGVPIEDIGTAGLDFLEFASGLMPAAKGPMKALTSGARVVLPTLFGAMSDAAQGNDPLPRMQLNAGFGAGGELLEQVARPLGIKLAVRSGGYQGKEASNLAKAVLEESDDAGRMIPGRSIGVGATGRAARRYPKMDAKAAKIENASTKTGNLGDIIPDTGPQSTEVVKDRLGSLEGAQVGNQLDTEMRRLLRDAIAQKNAGTNADQFSLFKQLDVVDDPTLRQIADTTPLSMPELGSIRRSQGHKGRKLFEAADKGQFFDYSDEATKSALPAAIRRRARDTQTALEPSLDEPLRRSSNLRTIAEAPTKSTWLSHAALGTGAAWLGYDFYGNGAIDNPWSSLLLALGLASNPRALSFASNTAGQVGRKAPSIMRGVRFNQEDEK